ncbi:hypothetical protein C6P45_005110 [Maudiozyma exigua]|uniref:SWIRM domain-containing protein n=1 Tax=Maudiozyma exigua TaxID=34358 RepID=A0A9P7B9G9_MAUEX|nr:hypothetical protein C6P45_005110 [Kazachstania exigua]
MTNHDFYKNYSLTKSSPDVSQVEFPGFVPISKKNYTSDSDTHLNSVTFPSPPLSPKLNNSDDNRKVSLGFNTLLYPPPTSSALSKSNKDLFVKPVWSNGTTTKQYTHSTRKFLQEYNFKQRNNNLMMTQSFDENSNRNISQTQMTIQSPYNTRKNKLLHHNNVPLRVRTLQNQQQQHNFIKPKRKVHKIPNGYSHANTQRPMASAISHAQHLASSTAVASVPKYVPNISWNQLKDYSPSMANISNDNLKALRIEWKGSPMDLSRDPLRNHLHPAELVLAEILRLPCDLYLDSKRRLFLEKVYKLRKGLPFRRTDAQKACRIDVNKASRLYAAFEKVGWLKDSNFSKYL